MTLSRRALLAAAAGMAVAGPLALERLASVRAPERRRTLSALVEAVGGSDPDAAATRLIADYRTSLPSRRAAIDEIVASLEKAGFVDRPVAERTALLRTWAGDEHTRAFAARAIALAGTAYGPAGDDYRAAPVTI